MRLAFAHLLIFVNMILVFFSCILGETCMTNCSSLLNYVTIYSHLFGINLDQLINLSFGINHIYIYRKVQMCLSFFNKSYFTSPYNDNQFNYWNVKGFWNKINGGFEFSGTEPNRDSGVADLCNCQTNVGHNHAPCNCQPVVMSNSNNPNQFGNNLVYNEQQLKRSALSNSLLDMHEQC